MPRFVVHSTRLRPVVLALVSLFVACEPEPADPGHPGTPPPFGSVADGGAPVDAGALADAGSAFDAGTDAGPPFDAGAATDAGSVDAGSVKDAGTPTDSGTPVDAGAANDAGRSADAGSDAGFFDAGTFDAGTFDAGTTDAGTTDAGTFDAGAVDAGGVSGDGGCPGPAWVGAEFRMRVVAANISSGNGQSYDPGEGQRILQGLRPDIVMIQEFNYSTNSDEQISAFANSLNAGTDAGMHWARGAFGSIPNGVISRWPIVSSGDWVDPEVSNRAFTWAKVDLPGPRDVWVVSLHLLTKGTTYRNSEAQALIGFLDANVPANDFLLVGGDFNTDSRSESAISTLNARLYTSSPHPADQSGKQGTNASREKPYDWVLASRCLSPLQTPVKIGLGVYNAGLVVDTRVYNPISELAPALTSDSDATNMQHMAVVKDYVIQP